MTQRMFFAGTIIAALSFALYVVQVNALTAGAYSGAVSEKQLQQLKDNNKVLENKAAKSFSISKLVDLAESLNFEKAGTVSYIQVIAKEVAKAR